MDTSSKPLNHCIKINWRIKHEANKQDDHKHQQKDKNMTKNIHYFYNSKFQLLQYKSDDSYWNQPRHRIGYMKSEPARTKKLQIENENRPISAHISPYKPIPGRYKARNQSTAASFPIYTEKNWKKRAKSIVGDSPGPHSYTSNTKKRLCQISLSLSEPTHLVGLQWSFTERILRWKITDTS